MMDVTFVSCWYNLKNKYDLDSYKSWMKNFVTHTDNFNLVIFTDSKSRNIFDDITLKSNVKIIISEKENWSLSSMKQKFIDNHKNNPYLNNRIEPDVNILWCEKTYFVKRAIEENYFSTNYFGWCDIGYFRNSTSEEWPNKEKILNLKKDKIYYTLVNKAHFRKIAVMKKRKKEKFIIPPTQTSIAGGFFIGTKEMCLDWSVKFDKKLKDYFSNNLLVKDDQMIVLDCILEDEKYFELIYGDWFNFKEYFS